VKFGKGDRFVFSSFDADTITEGQQKLRFIGKQAFSGVAGELRATRSALEADLNGDSLADFAVNLRGNSLISSSNLVL
jgi:serralysin